LKNPFGARLKITGNQLRVTDYRLFSTGYQTDFSVF
jgi:hypothetical protein